MLDIEEQKNGIIVPFKVITKASRNAIGDEFNKALKLYITSAPIEGKANKSIIKFLSKLLGLPQKDIVIVSGIKNSLKKIQLKIGKKDFLNKIK